MSEYLERTNASKPTFGDYVTLEMKRYGVPNEYFIHDVMTHPFTSNSWRNVPIDARDPEEHLHDTSEAVISVCTQGFHLSGWHIFNVRLSDVLPMKGDKWAWKESPLRSRIAELERDKKALRGIEENLREHIDIGTLQLSVATARIAELEAAQKEALSLLPELERGHHYCDDCWYSCPKAVDGCCDESRGDECDCGADDYNALLAKIIGLLTPEVQE